MKSRLGIAFFPVRKNFKTELAINQYFTELLIFFLVEKLFTCKFFSEITKFGLYPHCNALNGLFLSL